MGAHTAQCFWRHAVWPFSEKIVTEHLLESNCRDLGLSDLQTPYNFLCLLVLDMNSMLTSQSILEHRLQTAESTRSSCRR